MPTARKFDTAETEFTFTEGDYRTIVELVRHHCGIALGPNKYSMVYARLARRLRELRIDTFQDYCRILKDAPSGAEMTAFTNAMTTNLTRFFREGHHFEHLANKALPEIARAGPGRLRIWSAGCSTGEEPYSIAATVMRNFPGVETADARILATDLDTNVLAKGRLGQYPSEAWDDIPATLRDGLFLKTAEGVTAHERLRRLIAFKPLNLLHRWPLKGPFDVIFCRNVMIYFDGPTKTELVHRFAGMLRPGGILYVGHAETLLDLQNLFRLEGRTTYRRL